MVELLSNLDPSDFINVALGLLILYWLLHRHRGDQPMSPEWRAFWIKFIENNTGVCWAFLVMMIFLGGILHASHDNEDPALVETLKSILLVSSGWLGNMLTGRVSRAADNRQELQPGIPGTQETKTVTETVTKQESKPEPPVPTEPVKVEVQEPLSVVVDEKKEGE